MIRTTITLTEELALLVEREAKRTETTVSEVVRRALVEHLGVGGGKRRLRFAAVGRSGHRTTARDAEKILAREWGKHGAGDR